MNENTPESHLIILKNNKIEVGILPGAGGRVVLLRHPEVNNILFADSGQWGQAFDSIRPEPAANAPWVAFMGHIMWVGPQSDFWNQQNLDESMKGKVWPPDPWMAFGLYRVIKQTETLVELLGPASPVTGLQLTKTVELRPDGTIFLKTLAVNTRNETVAWDLWSNTRFPADTPFFVPVTGENDVKNDTLGQTAIPYSLKKGMFCYQPVLQKGKSISNKAFIYPAQPWIAARRGKILFIKSFEKIPRDSIHPEQGAVEIYLQTPSKDMEGLLELEAHGAYNTLAPGDTMEWTETWTLLELPDDASDDEAIRLLQSSKFRISGQ